MNKTFKAFVFGAALVAGGLFAAAVGSLTTFTPGTAIKSGEVNGNFAALKTAVEALEAPIGAARLSTSGIPADGKVLKLEGGNLNWADDLVGSGSVASYSAGGGLALNGTTFSVADGGITLPRLDIAGTAGGGKVLGYNGSKLEWQTLAPSSTSVQTDGTLKGNGTSGNPLGIRLPLSLDATSSASATLSVASRGTAGAVFGESTGGAIGVQGNSTINYGVLGISNSSTINTPGVKGINSSATGQVVGVLGQSLNSPIGTGVAGYGSVTGGYFRAEKGSSGGFDPVGVYGVANATNGVGVRGESANWFGGVFVGGAYGLLAQSPSGNAIVASNGGGSSTLVLTQQGNGDLISGHMPNNIFFRVDNNGTVRTSGDVIAKGVTLVSDRNAKANFKAVNTQTVLDKVTRLTISRWNYKSDAAEVQHIGPMAQDFYAAFGLNGSDDKHISAVDVQGVALAAIQGLNQKLEVRDARISQLEATLAQIEERLSRLEQK